MTQVFAGVPTPPLALRMPHGWEQLYTAACVLAFVVMAANAVRLWRKGRDPLPLVLIGAGAVCVLIEPMVDVLGACWYPRGSGLQLFELMDRPIPFLVLPGYTFFMGGLTVIALHVLQGQGPRGLLRLYPFMILLELPFEIVANHSGVYTYYGQQPLRIASFPIWWLFVNTMVPVVAAALLRALRPMLTGAAVLLVLPLLPMVDAGVNAAFAWPTWTVLSSDVPGAVTQLAGLTTCGLAVGALVLLVRVLERSGPDSPLPGGAVVAAGPAPLEVRA
jgi:hypothetical protein